MSEKRFRVNDLTKFNYSEIGEYVDENHTPVPLRNDEVCKLLNEQQSTINNQEQKIKILQQEINDTQAILGMLTEKLKGWNDE